MTGELAQPLKGNNILESARGVFGPRSGRLKYVIALERLRPNSGRRYATIESYLPNLATLLRRAHHRIAEFAVKRLGKLRHV